MTFLSIAAVLAFDAVLSLIEIPGMLKERLFKELAVYSAFLLLGSAVMILRSLDVKIPNPTDFVMWVYSPLEGLMKGLTSG